MALNIKTLDDGLNFLYRRKYQIVVTWLILSVIAVIVAYNLPKTFRSTATLLIEAPIPGKILETMVPTRIADEQMQSLYQKVMTTENLFSIIQSTSLYGDLEAGVTKQELIEAFKESADVELATSSLSSSKSSAGIAEIAIDISFSDTDPVMARDVASKLATLFIEQNDKARANRAMKATAFLQEESDKLNLQLKDIDGKIVKYKEEHNFSLPEQIQGNIAAIDRGEDELRDTEGMIRSTKERVAYLSAELARTDANTQTLSIDSKEPQNKEDALEKMQADYFRLSTLYSPSHPTIARLKREIKALDPGFDFNQNHGNLAKELANTQDRLKAMEKIYADNHPDVLKLRKHVESLRQNSRISPKSEAIEEKPKPRISRNPAYMNLEGQYNSSQAELQSLVEKQAYLRNKLEQLRATMIVAPQIEMGYSDLLRERDNIVKKYNQLKERLADAKVLQTLEEEQQGQTLTMIEPPVVPVNPEKAIRRKVAIGGFFVGLFAGIGLALALEFFDPAIRGYRSVVAVTGLTPLVVIPYIESPEEEAENHLRQHFIRKLIIWSALILLVTLSVIAVSFFSFTAS